MCVTASLVLLGCSGSGGADNDIEQQPTIGGINGPAVVDPSFDPFATVASAPADTDGG